jgi:2-polyprenyl-3-methyl-5-hydroxy-6-metoxy-1,4-benzoquinol methylase
MEATRAMPAWTRTVALDGGAVGECTETWTCAGADGAPRAFDVEVTVGKRLDVVALKGASTDEIREYADFLKQTASHLYAPSRPRREVEACPCCEAPAAAAATSFVVFDVPYSRCATCGHTFVRSQPSTETLTELFAESEEHSTTYTDRASLEPRLQQVMRPKLDWVARTYERRRGCEPRSVLDVGAAGGHFVEVARRLGLRAEGFEISKASRRFAKAVFDIELSDADFLTGPVRPGAFDLLTFWGLLEYTPEPRRFLERARQWLDAQTGMLIVEVPRVDCVGTAVQVACAETIARHLDPTSHVNLFSDASLASVLVRAGFRPVAVWYFGMDAYELLMQMALRLDGAPVMDRLASFIPALQASMDAGRVCDDIVVAAVPEESR